MISLRCIMLCSLFLLWVLGIGRVIDGAWMEVVLPSTNLLCCGVWLSFSLGWSGRGRLETSLPWAARLGILRFRGRYGRRVVGP